MTRLAKEVEQLKVSFQRTKDVRDKVLADYKVMMEDRNHKILWEYTESTEFKDAVIKRILNFYDEIVRDNQKILWESGQVLKNII